MRGYVDKVLVFIMVVMTIVFGFLWVLWLTIGSVVILSPIVISVWLSFVYEQWFGKNSH